MEDQNRVLFAALAGLLHDIGKFAQRADVGISRIWDAQAQQDYKYKHALLTADFIDAYVPEAWRAEVKRLAANHHRPTSPAEQLIRLADQLSAGERSKGGEPGQDERAIHPRQLRSIFCSLTTQDADGKDQTAPETLYLPLKVLALKEGVIFPGKPDDEQEVWKAYGRLWEAFCGQAKTLKAAHQDGEHLEIYLESLLQLLQRYTWCIPSAYFKSIPDISLYDHGRMTAALAVCLANLPDGQTAGLLEALQKSSDDPIADPPDSPLATPLALLVGGDISGIQDFIYTLSSKGAAKTLRGRSFYLQLLTEAVLRFVLRSLGLTYTNVIYSGGGHFYLLAPLQAAEKLPDIQSQVTQKLLRHHDISLYLALGSASVPGGGFRPGLFPTHWSEMHAALGRAKQRRYTELDQAMYASIFQPPDQGGNPDDTCPICGGDGRKVHTWDAEREEQTKICLLCESFVDDLGGPLPTARFVALGFCKPVETKPNAAKEVLREFGMHIQLLKSADQAPNLPEAEHVVLWALDDPPQEQWPAVGKTPAMHLLRYTVNTIPRDEDGQPLTFDALQKRVSGGFKRLGVLRMDVDNLGNIFKSGLGSNATLARLSTLSFQMALFFEGWVKRLCEAQAYQGLIYAVYAGGDDVFLIGPWDRMPELAQEINTGFAAYTAGHPGLHLSAGMAFMGGKYPIYQAADDAGEMLEKAKGLPGKNAFAFLGQPWSWASFKQVSDKHLRVHKLVSAKDSDEEALQGPQAIIQVLRQLAEDEADQAKVQQRPVWGPWMWKGAYLLTRMAERYKETNKDLHKEILAIRDDLDANNYSEIPQWGAAARWTQLHVRKSGSRQED